MWRAYAFFFSSDNCTISFRHFSNFCFKSSDVRVSVVSDLYSQWPCSRSILKFYVPLDGPNVNNSSYCLDFMPTISQKRLPKYDYEYWNAFRMLYVSILRNTYSMFFFESLVFFLFVSFPAFLMVCIIVNCWDMTYEMTGYCSVIWGIFGYFLLSKLCIAWSSSI